MSQLEEDEALAAMAAVADAAEAEEAHRERGLRSASFAGGVVKPGQESKGVHASGFPIYTNLPSQLDADTMAKLQMPTSMAYTEEGAYDNTPAQKAEAEGLEMPSGMKYSEEGVYDHVQPMRGEEGYDDGQTEAASEVAKTAFDDPIVHESEMRRSFLQGRILEDPDRGKACLNCTTCPGFEEHYWRKVCKWCRCRRIDHKFLNEEKKIDLGQSLISTDETLAKMKQKYAWTPMGLNAEEIEAYFRSIPAINRPIIGTEGELFRRKQHWLQTPPHDMNWELCDQLTGRELEAIRKFDRARMREAFDIGDVMPCPDLARPDACAECYLKEDGTHWPYCSKFVDPAEQSKASKGGAPALPASRKTSANAFGLLDDMPDIKTMRRRKRESQGSAQASPARAARNAGADASAAAAAAQAAGEGGEEAEAAPPKQSGLMCRHCCLPLMVGELVVQVGRFTENEGYFHPRCVTCSLCGELLVDLRCYADVGWEERGQKGAEKKLFCGRHWADNRRPRCLACDETIHQEKHVFELNKPWHFRHFCCYICDANLTEHSSYVPRDGKPLCVKCFSEHIAEKCLACGEAINPTRDGGGKISVGDKHWHPPCFCCIGCKTPLQGKPCVPKGNLVYCKSCYKRVKRKMKKVTAAAEG